MSPTALRERPVSHAGAIGPPPTPREVTIGTDGDLAADDFEAFAAAGWTALVRTAYLLTGDHHEAEDLVQATFAKVYAGWHRIRHLDSPDLYVRRALINNNISRHRKRRVTQLLMPHLPDRAERDRDPDRLEQRSALLTALASLPARQRAAVVLRYWEDLSEQQTAEVLGCSVGNVKSQTSRAIGKLRSHPDLAEYATEVAW